MDEILIFSKDEETHLEHLEITFIKLKKSKLKIKISKCSFLKITFALLKTSTICRWYTAFEGKNSCNPNLAPPTNVHEIQQVMGMFNYYRRFILNFSEIAKRIVELTKKGNNFN